MGHPLLDRDMLRRQPFARCDSVLPTAQLRFFREKPQQELVMAENGYPAEDRNPYAFDSPHAAFECHHFLRSYNSLLFICLYYSYVSFFVNIKVKIKKRRCDKIFQFLEKRVLRFLSLYIFF